MKIYIITTLFLFASTCYAQSKKVKFSALDGYIIAGYVDNGAFINFTGPSLNCSIKESKFIIGMLPSLRFKKDDGQTKNSVITPNLGLGFTYSYKMWSFQIPLYYNTKTDTENGKWHLGVGVGLRIYKIRNGQED
jgi:hypothetical protein